MDEFIMRLIEMTPAVGVLIFIIVRQEQRVETLVNTLVEYIEDCHNDDDDDEPKNAKPLKALK